MTTVSPPNCATCGAPLCGDGTCAHCLFDTVLGTDELFAPEEAAPSQIGDYELLEEIARGGMGVVWRARQRRLNRTVALKLLRESSLPGEAAARRFRTEAEAAAALRHPHIVDVHEVGETGGRWFLSMELLAGTLAGRGAMPAREAAELIAKVARAVQYAHDRGILHRDLKPANVLLDESGEPRVGDFGLARFAESDSHLTVSGTLLGTPAYMSPEQASGRELTTASDIYSLGAIFYELLAGRPPFEGATMVEVVRKVCDQEPKPPRQVEGGGEVPRDLEVIVLKCLEKNPAARFASALALAEEIERWLRGEPILARPAGAVERLLKWARRRPALAALWAVGALALLVILVGGVIFNRHLDRQRKSAEAATRETLHRLARQHAQSAMNLLETGDANRGLLSLAEAIGIGTGDPAADRLNRLRFASIVRLSPRLEDLWFTPEGTRMRAHFSADGKSVLLVHGPTAQLRGGPPMNHDTEIAAAEVNADGTRVICGTSDGRWTLWDARAGKVIATGAGRIFGFPRVLACRPRGVFGGDRFVVVEDEKIVRQFQSRDGQPVGPQLTHERPVVWAVLEPDAEKLFALTDDGNLHRSTADDPRQTLVPMNPDPGLLPQTMMTNPRQRDRFLTLLSENGRIVLTGWEYRPGSSEPGPVSAHGFQSPGPVVTMGWKDEGIRSTYLMSKESGAVVRSPWQTNDEEVLPAGTRVLAGDLDDTASTALTLTVNGAAQRWDLYLVRATGSRVWCLGRPLEARLSPDGAAATIVSSTGAWLWRWPEHDGARFAFPAESEQKSVRFSADSTRLRVSPADGPAQEFDVVTGRMVESAPDAAEPVIAESEGRLEAVEGDDLTVRIVDKKSGGFSGAPMVHPAPVSHTRFSPDESLLCTMWSERDLRLWDAATGEPATPVFAHPGSTRSVWSPDGRWLATFGKSPEVRVWDLSPAGQSPEAMKSLARLLSAHRLIPGSDSGLIALTTEELRKAWEQAGFVKN